MFPPLQYLPKTVCLLDLIEQKKSKTVETVLLVFSIMFNIAYCDKLHDTYYLLVTIQSLNNLCHGLFEYIDLSSRILAFFLNTQYINPLHLD